MSVFVIFEMVESSYRDFWRYFLIKSVKNDDFGIFGSKSLKSDNFTFFRILRIIDENEGGIFL